MKTLQCIMFVDDDADDLFLNAREIEKISFHIDVLTHSVSEALDYLSLPGTMPDLIFLDVNMPAINGWDFLERYTKLGRQVHDRAKIIMLTTSANPKDKQRAEQWSFVYGYIVKPLTKEIVEDIIAKYFTPPG